MRWHEWVVLTAGSTGSALRAVRPPNLHVTPGGRRDLVTPQVRRVAKKDDLRFFAKSICHIDYEHLPALAPTQDILDEYKKSKGSWQAYAEKFLNLMAQRKIETLDRDILQPPFR
jgi:Protein of unknown function, DUF488